MRRRDVKYSYYDENGMDNLAWKGKPIVEMLQAVLLDPTATSAQKKDATAILGFISRRQKAASGSEFQQGAAMMATYDAHALWEWPASWQIVTDGAIERVRQIEPIAA
jgi:hypothetical protein